VNNVFRKTAKRLKNDLIFAAVVCIAALHRLMPRNMGLWLFESIGIFVFCIPTRDRERTVGQLRMIFGEKWPEEKIRSMARRVYRDLGKNAFDALFFARGDKKRLDRFIECDDLSEFREAYALGRGVVAITAHCGCFEMLLHYFAAQGFCSFAIGKEVYDKRLDRLVTGLRSGPNITYLYRSENPRTIIKLLKQGKLMGALIDQDTKVDGVFAHFCGKTAYTPFAPIKIAMRYDIPVFVVTTARDNRGIHRIFVGRRCTLQKTGDETRDIVYNVEAVNARISETIMNYPSQWVWMHRRWNRRPEDPEYRDIANIEWYEDSGKSYQ